MWTESWRHIGQTMLSLPIVSDMTLVVVSIPVVPTAVETGNVRVIICIIIDK